MNYESFHYCHDCCYCFHAHTALNNSCQHYKNEEEMSMSCKDCAYFDENQTSGYKGYCSYYSTYEDPDGSCSHFTCQHYKNEEEMSMSCKDCTYFDENQTSGYKGYCSYYSTYEDPDGSCSHFSGSSSSTGCFLTSACVAYKGLSDDCMELETMRKFRDNVLRQYSYGQELIEEYYRIAPDIVRGIEASPDKNRIYDTIYHIIIKCVEYIQQNKYESATSCYRKMVEDLKVFQVHSLKAGD